MNFQPGFNKRERLSVWLGLLQVTALLVFCLSIISLGGFSYWILELTSHFRLLYLLGALVCFLLFLLIRHYLSALIMFLLLIINIFSVAPVFSIVEEDSASEFSQTLKIFHSNVYSQNREYHLLLNAIAFEEPDIVILQEVTPLWQKSLSLLVDDYPYQKVVAREGNFGIAILAKVPLQDIEVVDLADIGLPSIQATINLDNQPVRLLTTHALPPVTPWLKQQRDRQLNAVADFVVYQQQPVIVVGDLNVTHWSPDYHALVEKTGLINARQGWGILPTWPGKFSGIGLPIDHLLYSEALQVRAIHTYPDVGSDHLPLVVQLGFKKTT